MHVSKTGPFAFPLPLCWYTAVLVHGRLVPLQAVLRREQSSPEPGWYRPGHRRLRQALSTAPPGDPLVPQGLQPWLASCLAPLVPHSTAALEGRAGRHGHLTVPLRGASICPDVCLLLPAPDSETAPPTQAYPFYLPSPSDLSEDISLICPDNKRQCHFLGSRHGQRTVLAHCTHWSNEAFS